MFRRQEQTAAAISRLSAFAVGLEHAALPAAVSDRLPLLVSDLAGVTVAGMRTPELAALVEAWPLPAGAAPLPGTDVVTSPETSARLAAVAACSLELDEGNKYAAGHPAAHVFFAAVAAAQEAGRPVSGDRFLTAVAVGYEVAARFGRATTSGEGWHPHGHWGATGAACAAALLLDATPEQVAAAIDASTGLVHVTPWGTVLDGDFTRNLWIAGANIAGLHAARLALAGLVDNPGTTAHSLGGLVGQLDPESLVGDLGERWLAAEGYLKQHAACSYTHPAIDLVQALLAGGAWRADDVVAVRVRTHSLARPLLGRHPRNRLAAMFSLPFVVATAVVSGTVDPSTMEPGSAAFARAEAFSDRVEVVVDEALDAHLPHLRCTEVRVELADGSVVGLGAPNPLGDAHYFPLGPDEVRAKLERLLGVADAGAVLDAVAALPGAPDARPVLARLALARRATSQVSDR